MNYRPISVIYIVLKMLISDQLVRYVNDNNIIINKKSAFRKCHSTETALLQVIDYTLNIHCILNIHGKGILIGVLLLDLN